MQKRHLIKRCKSGVTQHVCELNVWHVISNVKGRSSDRLQIVLLASRERRQPAANPPGFSGAPRHGTQARTTRRGRESERATLRLPLVRARASAAARRLRATSERGRAACTREDVTAIIVLPTRRASLSRD